MPKINPITALLNAIFHSDNRVKSTDGHPIIPTWMRESRREYLLPYNPVHTYLKNGREQDGHRVSRQDWDQSYNDD